MSNSCNPMDYRLLCPWDFPGKNTGVGSHLLLQGIFPTQGSNPGLLHCRQSPALQVDSLLTEPPRKPLWCSSDLFEMLLKKAGGGSHLIPVKSESLGWRERRHLLLTALSVNPKKYQYLGTTGWNLSVLRWAHVTNSKLACSHQW